MNLGLENKRVLITGGTSGIGLAAATLMAEAGARVAVVGRSRSRFEALSPSEKAGLQLYPGDVSSPDSCKQIAEGIAKEWGGLDILVNSAGVYKEGRLENLTEAAYREIMDTNVKGTLFMTAAVVPYLAQGSCVINIASDAGISGNYGCPVYCASKGAIVAFTKAMALDLAPKTRVNCLCPGDVATPLVAAQLQQGGYSLEDMAAEYPLGRIARAEEVAYVIAMVASPLNSFMTGAVLPVDGGLTAK